MMNTKIYFLCPNNSFISGGVKQIYRQVEILNNNGIQAAVLLQGESKQKWFHTTAPIVYSPYLFKILKYTLQNRKISLRKKMKLYFLKQKSVALDENTILVIPEIYGDKIDKIAVGIKKVIFNQNCYYTFNQYDINTDYPQTPYTHTDVLATIVVSEDSLAYLNYTFAKAKVYRCVLGINSKIFYYSPEKQRQICFMPRKLTDDVRQVLQILKQRGSLKGWKLMAIDGKNEQEVAQIMRESTFFLSFNHREGFGLPPVEAMACGCYVVGYDGEAGKEYFKDEFSSVVKSGDIIAYVKKIEELLALYEASPQVIIQKGEKASNFVLQNYSMDNEEKSIIAILNNLLKQL